MLGKLREEQIPCRAVVLTAYSEFDYAKQAIDHGVENYLLKPIKIPELKQVLQKTADEIRRVESQEKILSMDNIFLGCLNGQLEVDTELNRMTKERYGFTVEEPVEMFAGVLRSAGRPGCGDVGTSGTKCGWIPDVPAEK